MGKLNQEYTSLLSGPRLASDRLCELEKCFNSDKHPAGVVVDCVSCSIMYRILFALSDEEVIWAAELEDFSEWRKTL